MTKLDKLTRVGLPAAIAAFALAAPAHAQEINEDPFIFNSLSFLMHGFMVMWMAAGFCMLEAGLVRSKNVATMCVKNIALYSIAAIMYWLVGFNTMYPGDFGKPVKEDDFEYDAIPPQYFGVAWMKLYVEKQCEFYSRLGRTKYTVVRHSNIYGPYDKYDLEKSHVFGATLTRKATGLNKYMLGGT